MKRNINRPITLTIKQRNKKNVFTTYSTDDNFIFSSTTHTHIPIERLVDLKLYNNEKIFRYYHSVIQKVLGTVQIITSTFKTISSENLLHTINTFRCKKS